VKSFQSNVKLITYGDDNAMGIHPRCSWYNHTAIARKYGEIGIEYTMADKEAESVPFISIDDVSFLKRTWRFEEAVNDYVAPLDRDSIAKSLTVWTYSKTVSEPVQGVDVISSAIREYFFHGREIFEEKRTMLMDICDKLNWTPYVKKSTFPSWQELVENWYKVSETL
jgi:succinylarginine dihydrolase